jgi:hypothetical protein
MDEHEHCLAISTLSAFLSHSACEAKLLHANKQRQLDLLDDDDDR